GQARTSRYPLEAKRPQHPLDLPPAALLGPVQTHDLGVPLAGATPPLPPLSVTLAIRGWRGTLRWRILVPMAAILALRPSSLRRLTSFAGTWSPATTSTSRSAWSS